MPDWLKQSLVDQTIVQRYDSIKGFTNGFDYLRLFLAAMVVMQHSFLSSYGDYLNQLWGSYYRIIFAPILLMFFGLSGFLVSGSLKKNPTMTSFVTLRAVRLVPALAVEILLSALIIGPLFTQLPIVEYFLNKEFFLYMLNAVGIIHRSLPGVFNSLPNTLTNVSLWTLPLELECYVALLALYFFGVIKNRNWLLVIVIASVAIGTLTAFKGYDPFWAHTRPLSRSLLVSFLVGVLINLFSDRILLSKRLFILALLLIVATTIDYRTIYISTIPSVYVCVYLGMMHPNKNGIFFSGDYSYGLYLFAYPLQQVYTSLFPNFRFWYLNLTFTLAFGFLYAAFSWWVVEKPLLSKKKFIVATAEKFKGNVLNFFRARVELQ